MDRLPKTASNVAKLEGRSRPSPFRRSDDRPLARVLVFGRAGRGGGHHRFGSAAAARDFPLRRSRAARCAGENWRAAPGTPAKVLRHRPRRAPSGRGAVQVAQRLLVAAGCWLFLSPWIFESPSGARWNVWIAGVIVGLLGLAVVRDWRYAWLGVAAGAWLGVSAWVLPSSPLAAGNTAVAGAAVAAIAVVSALRLPERRALRA